MTSPFDEAALYQIFLDERSVSKKLPSLTTKSCIISSNSLSQDEKNNDIEQQGVDGIDNATQREIFNCSHTTVVNIRQISDVGDGIIEEYFDEIGDIEKNLHQVDETPKNESVQRMWLMSIEALEDTNATSGKIISTSNFTGRGQLNQRLIHTFMQQNNDGQQGDNIMSEKIKILMKNTYNHIYRKIVNLEILFP